MAKKTQPNNQSPTDQGTSAVPRANTLVHKVPPGRTTLGATADLAAEGITGNTVAVLDWSRTLYGDIDVTSLQTSILETTRRVTTGDLSGAEAMLMAQAVTLNTIFVTLARRAQGNEHVSPFQVNLRLALKAQGQCRATIEALALIRNPPVFAKQANITNGPQQVNNGPVVNESPSLARAGNLESEPNKLLEVDRERMDGSAKGATEDRDPALAALGTIDRANNSGREGALIAQRVSRRMPGPAS
jgi:hypothetical protein